MSLPAAAPSLGQDSSTSTEAARVLFERHRQRVLAFCLSRTRNRSDAEDATQTTFMYALSGLKRGVVPEFELSWLLRIAENVCHSQRRRAHRRYERDELPADVTSQFAGDPAVVSERLSTLSSALEQLPETQRRAIILREWRGLSYRDIAAELQMSHAAVETLLFRARRSLAKRVASFGVLGLQVLPSAARVVRWLLGPGAGKAAVVAATATTIGAGIAASEPIAARDAPVTVRTGPAAERPLRVLDADKAVKPSTVAPTRERSAPATAAVLQTEETDGTQVDSADPVAAELPVAAWDDAARTDAGSPSPPSSVRTDELGVAPLDEIPAIDEVVAVRQPVEEVTEPVVEVVRELEPAVDEVAEQLEPTLPRLAVVEDLPALELPKPLPSLPLP